MSSPSQEDDDFPVTDPAIPPLPYVPGFRVDITSHIAPHPFTNIGLSGPDARMERDCRDHANEESRKKLRKEQNTMGQAELVLRYPPLEESDYETSGPPYGPNYLPRIRSSATVAGDRTKATLDIIKPIRSGHCHRAQIVQCAVTPHDSSGVVKPYNAVAKIFDSLYYNPYSKSSLSDPAREADEDYSREAAAYEYIKSRLPDAPFVPQYFGCWTFSLPLEYKGTAHQRPVRLLLMEDLTRGECMRGLKDIWQRRLGYGPWDESKTFRLEVLAQVFHADMVLEQYGVNHNDLEPRNVMVVSNSAEGTDVRDNPRAVIIDFNVSRVKPLEPGKPASRPQNPAQMHNSALWWIWPGWPLEEWQWNEEAQDRWFESRFGGEETCRCENACRYIT